jgi:hypothetical protein
MGGDGFGVEEGCCAVRIEDGSKVEVAVAMGEVVEESNTVVIFRTIQSCHRLLWMEPLDN